MVKAELRIDARLEDWRDVREQCQWTGLLVGNGASCNVWPGFRYRSLLEEAQALGDERQLTREDLAIFSALRTTNFEMVLASLQTAACVVRALGQDTEAIRRRYQSIQRALAAAVHRMHAPYGRLTDETLWQLQEAVSPYERVYSTNYDLLLYWAIMHDNRAVLRDYLWSGGATYFDIAQTKLYPGPGAILYLHGGLHLVRMPSGATKKPTKERGTLREQFGSSIEDGCTPLVVTEGTADDKLASIRRSDYLSFAYEQLAQHQGPLVIFGHRLSGADEHIARAIRESEGAWPIAVSLRKADDLTIIERKVEQHKRLGREHLIFFDAATHPLGDPSMRLALR